MKALTNSDVLYLGAILPGKSMIFLADLFQHEEDFDLQKCIALNEPLLLAETEAIIKAMIKSLGKDFKMNSPEAKEILSKESGLKLVKIKMSDEFMKSLKPDRAKYFCLMCIREEEN